MAIAISPESTQLLIASIKRYVAENLEQDIGDLKAVSLLDYFLKEIGPTVYNRAIADAQEYVQARAIALEGVCFEVEEGDCRQSTNLELRVHSPERLDATGTSFAERRTTFDDVAELYELFRPGYPEQLADDVISQSGIPRRGRILEIGCGSGKATTLFAARGYRILCLEPGLNLARLAEGKLAAFPDAQVERCTFEEWRLEESALDLVIAAQSFHFIEPASGFSKVARALRAGGAFAAFANHPARGDSEVYHRVQEAYAVHAPALAKLELEAGLEDRIDETGLFETVVMTRYRWQAVYTAAEYVGLMETQSHHRLLPRDQRTALLQAIHDAITGLGGSFTVDYATRLHLAKRRVTA